MMQVSGNANRPIGECRSAFGKITFPGATEESEPRKSGAEFLRFPHITSATIRIIAMISSNPTPPVG